MDMYQILAKLQEVDNEATRAAVEQLKALNKVEESAEPVAEKYMGFKKLEKSIAKRGDVDNPAAVAAAIGRKKYGKEKFQKMAAAGKRESVEEADMEEGNEFSGELAKAKAAGAKEFKVDGKTYQVKEGAKPDFLDVDKDGDKKEPMKKAIKDKESKLDESIIEEGFADFFDKKLMYKKIGADVDGRSDDYVVTFKDGSRKRYQEVDGRKRVTTLEPIEKNIEVDTDGEVVKRSRGRPKGTGKKIGARGKTNVREDDISEDYDEDEYDQEGEMAKGQLRTIEDAAKELQDCLSDNENLPEWVQSKITKALDYLDTARDYMKSEHEGEEEDMEDEEGDEEIEERELSKGEMKKREKYVKGMKKAKGDFEKRYGDRGEEVMYATATKMAKENTTAGSVATAPADNKAKGVFGKGVYESQFEAAMSQLNESVSVNISSDDQGQKNVTVTASDADAEGLSQLLQMAGLFGSKGYEDACPECGQAPCGCQEAMEEDYSNSPEPQTKDTEFMTNKIAGGLNKPKVQVNPNWHGDNPLAMPALGKTAHTLNLSDSELKEAVESRLFDLYKKYEGK